MKPFEEKQGLRVKVLEGTGSSRTFIGYMDPKPKMETSSGEYIIEVRDDGILLGRYDLTQYTRKPMKGAEAKFQNLAKNGEVAISKTEAKKFGWTDADRMDYPRAKVWVVFTTGLLFDTAYVEIIDSKARGQWFVSIPGTCVQLSVRTEKIGEVPVGKELFSTEREALASAIEKNINTRISAERRIDDLRTRLDDLEREGC